MICKPLNILQNTKFNPNNFSLQILFLKEIPNDFKVHAWIEIKNISLHQTSRVTLLINKKNIDEILYKNKFYTGHRYSCPGLVQMRHTESYYE